RRAIEPARGWEALALGTVAARDAGFRALLRRCLPAMLRARRKRRGHGTGDPRPLAPSPTVMRKLAWVHRLVLDALAGMQALREPRLAWDPRSRCATAKGREYPRGNWLPGRAAGHWLRTHRRSDR